MASFQNPSTFETQIPNDLLTSHIMQIHAKVSKLESLKPSKQINNLLTHLVKLCILPSTIDVKNLPKDKQKMRESLIVLCGQAEGLLELEFATLIKKTLKPLDNLDVFPYYGNYVKLANYEYKILKDNGILYLKKVAFVGSGPMPLSSIVLAMNHMKTTHFDNYDIDEAANDAVREIVSSNDKFEKRMKFVTCNILDVKEKLAEYDCIFLAALVGMNKEDKVKIIEHIRKYMKEESYLVVRSAKGARAFLYPIVEEHDLLGFKVISVFHPTDDVINSVLLAQKYCL